MARGLAGPLSTFLHHLFDSLVHQAPSEGRQRIPANPETGVHLTDGPGPKGSSCQGRDHLPGEADDRFGRETSPVFVFRDDPEKNGIDLFSGELLEERRGQRTALGDVRNVFHGPRAGGDQNHGPMESQGRDEKGGERPSRFRGLAEILERKNENAFS